MWRRWLDKQKFSSDTNISIFLEKKIKDNIKNMIINIPFTWVFFQYFKLNNIWYLLSQNLNVFMLLPFQDLFVRKM